MVKKEEKGQEKAEVGDPRGKDGGSFGKRRKKNILQLLLKGRGERCLYLCKTCTREEPKLNSQEKKGTTNFHTRMEERRTILMGKKKKCFREKGKIHCHGGRKKLVGDNPEKWKFLDRNSGSKKAGFDNLKVGRCE